MRCCFSPKSNTSSHLIRFALVIASGGLILSLAEALLGKTCVRNTACAAIGLLFLELLTEQILGIIS